MNTIFCTLFNHFYLDKGLVLYDSLKEVLNIFRLYILCMDEKCFEILTDIDLPEVIPIKLSDIEDNDMVKAKQNRSFSEYCFTCSSSLVQFVLYKFDEHICTYIDADMFFYKNPNCLIDEMLNAGKTVMIVPHRFSNENKCLEKNGIYCVEFNTFVNEENSLKVLDQWRKDCLQCTSITDGIHFGDQKYLDDWPNNYPNTVHVCSHPGAGTAPWNISLYREADESTHTVFYKKDQVEVPIIFHHFQHIIYESRDKVNVGVLARQKNVDYKLVDHLYVNYLKKIEIKKKYLESNYGVLYLVKKHHANIKDKKWRVYLKSIYLVSWLYKKIFPHKCAYLVKL